MSARKLVLTIAGAGIAIVTAALQGGSNLPNPIITPDHERTLSTYSTAGPIDITNPFFQSLGTNGRTCNSCHVSSTAWTVSPPEIQARFEQTQGTDPIFRPVDGAVCPDADVSTEDARRAAYRVLLKKGLFRISLPVPPDADFRTIKIADPSHCDETTPTQLALFRRPLPATNLRFLATVMWDGRESPKGKPITADLTQQAIDATLGHAQAVIPPTPEQLRQIVGFETSLFTAQQTKTYVGDLAEHGGKGGAINLSQQDFYLGINDSLGGDPTGKAFNPVVFTLYNEWSNSLDTRKASIARGEMLFNTFPITITGVAGLNDLPGLEAVNGTCTTCHDAPNAGSHSLQLALNIGVTDYPALPPLDTNGLPVYTIQCNDRTKIVQTTDPGRALITGKCTDVGKTKGPILRGLAARAPYFHNGSAATPMDAVNFYDQRFNLNFTSQQKKDLVAFLNTL